MVHLSGYNETTCESKNPVGLCHCKKQGPYEKIIKLKKKPTYIIGVDLSPVIRVSNSALIYTTERVTDNEDLLYMKLK